MHPQPSTQLLEKSAVIPVIYCFSSKGCRLLPEDACHCFSWDRRLSAGCIQGKVGAQALFPSDFPSQKLLVFSGRPTRLGQHGLQQCPSHPERAFSPQVARRGV